MCVNIGIDIGGSTTKIVATEEREGELKLYAPIFVRAADPMTSLYGAFGKFTDTNGLALSDVRKVMVTGVGAGCLKKPLFCSRTTFLSPPFRLTSSYRIIRKRKR